MPESILTVEWKNQICAGAIAQLVDCLACQGLESPAPKILKKEKKINRVER